MASIFRKDDNFTDKPNRNPFDMSYQNNLTTKFGVLKPVYCQEVLPGDTFKIKPTMAMRFMPQVFPVQTRMRSHLHFFYVRNRNLWKDWEDFIGKTKDGLVPPYLVFNDNNKSMLSVGGICDSFGVPVVTNSDVPQEYTIKINNTAIKTEINHYYDFELQQRTNQYINYQYQYGGELSAGLPFPFRLAYSQSTSRNEARLYLVNGNDGMAPDFDSYDRFNITVTNTSSGGVWYAFLFKDQNGEVMAYKQIVDRGENLISLPRYSDIQGEFADSYFTELVTFLGVCYISAADQWFTSKIIPSQSAAGVRVENIPFGSNFPYAYEGQSSTDNALRISALPFRGYEAIYNSFYRNAENNPLIINGVPEYNKYNLTYEGGADTNNYQFFNRNWEDDFLTTALPSPQQGTAPLVGIVNRGDAPYVVTLSDEDGNQSRLKFSYQNGSVQVLADDEISQEVAGQLNEYFMESTNVGISIQDFRNVNSFLRWLENNIRKGFKYRDQIKGHFGVSVRYEILDMPEFIGGVSREVSVQQVTQMVENDKGNLGDYAGQAYAYGEGETISHYCDEHGFIIGILSVVPMANYSQMISKYLTKSDAFDYYFPEFGKIGMQPILNKEVTTLESLARGNQDEVFGYQRAWYDYIARVDEVHGLFTTNLRNFLIGRTFKDVPQLSSQFSTIQNEQLNNIFYVNDDEDKILGQIYFNVVGIRPIPVFGIPSIE